MSEDTYHTTDIYFLLFIMDIKQIEEEERKWQYKQVEFLKLAKEICILKKNTNELSIKNVAKERELNDMKKATIEKQTMYEVLKAQTAFMEGACKRMEEEKRKIVAENQEAKMRLWKKYKRFVEMVDEEEKKTRRGLGQLGGDLSDCKKKTANDVVIEAEIEVMREFVVFQEQKKKELLEFISKFETI